MKLMKGKLALWQWGVVVVLSALGVAGGIHVYGTYMPQRMTSPSQTTEQPKAPQPVSISSNTLYTGNIFWGRYINDWSMKSPLQTAYPFSRLNEFNRESYDAWITGLECPTVAGFSQTSAQENTTLSFNCSPEYLPEAAKWFTITTLANNHTDNRGAEGFEETKQQLDKHGIQYFGHYDPAITSDVCEVIALPVTVTYDTQETKREKLPVAMCGYHGVFKIPPAESIAQISKYAALMPVIAVPHMGAEYEAAPDALKTTTYRAMIDAGADMVLGDHPHWIQTTEAYQGKLIVYSMGNFLFDQQGFKELTRSAAIRVVMSTTEASSEQLSKWLKLGDTCGSFKDACLQEASEGSLEKLPIEYRYGVVGTNGANKITKPATEAEQAEILQRLNWAQTMSELQSPQGSL